MVWVWYMNIKVGFIYWILIDKKCLIEILNKNYNFIEKVYDFEVDVLLFFIIWGWGYVWIICNIFVK